MDKLEIKSDDKSLDTRKISRNGFPFKREIAGLLTTVTLFSGSMLLTRHILQHQNDNNVITYFSQTDSTKDYNEEKVLGQIVNATNLSQQPSVELPSNRLNLDFNIEDYQKESEPEQDDSSWNLGGPIALGIITGTASAINSYKKNKNTDSSSEMEDMFTETGKDEANSKRK